MTTLLKSITLVAALATAALFSSCGNNAPADATAEHGDHIYSCPMHPEVTGKEGDKCPKCGMPLEHTDKAPAEAMYACPMHAEVTGKMGDKCSKCGMALEPMKMDEHAGMEHSDAAGAYHMTFALQPAKAVMGKAVTLKFTPVKVGQESTPVPLDVVHEKKLHLIIVNSDLSIFDHIHPEFQEDGSYTLPYSFPAGGDFLLYADYSPTGGTKQVETIKVSVDGPALPAKEINVEQRTSAVDGYEVRIDPKAVLSTGSLQHFTAGVYKAGKKVDANTLENYLGAKAHVVVIGVDQKEYLHVHPEVEEGALDLHAAFEAPGFYKGWFQFQAGGKVHIAPFVLKVVGGNAAGEEAAHDHAGNAHGAEASGHDHAAGAEKEEHNH